MPGVSGEKGESGHVGSLVRTVEQCLTCQTALNVFQKEIKHMHVFHSKKKVFEFNL